MALANFRPLSMRECRGLLEVDAHTSYSKRQKPENPALWFQFNHMQRDQ